MGRDGLIETIALASPEDTLTFGRKFASLLPQNAVLALSGNLGAGKTTFVQGLALGLKIQEPIQSPTFVLFNAYNGLYHFDLYRLKKSEDFLALGFDEYFDRNGITAIEWPDKIADLLPERTIHIHFHYDGFTRQAEVRS